MFTLSTDTISFTGKILYSDWYVHSKNPSGTELPELKPFLNRWASIPIIGILAGITRIALSIIHILIHLTAAAFYRDKGHLYHALKGSTEMLRGAIESIPLVRYTLYFCIDPKTKNSSSGAASFFIIKIVNPKRKDGIDHHYRFA